MTLQRDAFIDVIYRAAQKDKDIVFLSADFGAEALDSFRENLPVQFMHCGISEAHMIDMAAGLALAGKKVFVYCMGPFMALRCLEQVKCSLAMMNLPVTMISAGIGLGYADAGPTHYTTEDIACLRSIVGMEVLTAADEIVAAEFARLSLEDPKLRYIRLDREALPTIYSGQRPDVKQGFQHWSGKDTCVLSSGYMLGRCLEASRRVGRIGVIDLFRIKPFPYTLLPVLDNYNVIVTVEEQCLPGGFGSAVIEVMNEEQMPHRLYRLGLPERYFFENGGRDLLLDSFGLSVNDIIKAATR